VIAILSYRPILAKLFCRMDVAFSPDHSRRESAPHRPDSGASSRNALDQLSSELGKTVNLAVLEDVHTLCLYRKEVSRFLKYEHGPGTKLPCYAASLGKVLLAGVSDEELNKRMDKIEFYPITPKTISSKKKLREEIIETRKRGYSICDQELSMDMYSIAVPLLDSQGEVVAAINASLEFSFKDSPNLKNVIKRLIETGEMISNSLGYKGVYPSYGR